MSSISLFLALILGGLVLWLGLGAARIGAVSQGQPIDPRPNEALLLIDLQTVFWEEAGFSPEAKARAQSTIEAEAEAMRARGGHVIALRHIWSLPVTKVLARLTMKGQAVEGTAGTEIAAPFQGLADEVLVKRVQDGFETAELDALLQRLNVGRLRVAGLDGEYCIARTVKAALNRGFEVQVLTAGVLTANPDKETAVMAELQQAGAVLVD